MGSFYYDVAFARYTFQGYPFGDGTTDSDLTVDEILVSAGYAVSLQIYVTGIPKNQHLIAGLSAMRVAGIIPMDPTPVRSIDFASDVAV